jgi:flagellar motor protein MotB
MRNQANTIYLGLAVLMMGLFASQVRQHSNQPSVEESAVDHSAATKRAPIPSDHPRIFAAYHALLADPIFSSKIDGISMIPQPGAGTTVSDHFVLVLQGSEVFGSREARVQKSWESLLDRIADILDDDPGLKIEISGYADADDPLENRNSESGSSPLAFSFARAEWIARYFETVHGADVAGDFILRGMGLSPKGKRVELKFLIPQTASSGN